ICAACTYEPDAHLVSCFSERGLSTNGSYVTAGDHAVPPDFRQPVPVATITLEEIAARLGVDAIDVLKVDCEGSEYSILRSPLAQRCRYIFGEYHVNALWDAFRAQHFAAWPVVMLTRSQQGDAGIFHLRNPEGA